MNRRHAVIEARGHAVRLPELEGQAWLRECGIATQVARIIDIEKGEDRREDNLLAADLASVLGRLDLMRELLVLSSKPAPYYGPGTGLGRARAPG